MFVLSEKTRALVKPQVKSGNSKGIPRQNQPSANEEL
jgi:hypothetical protein